MKKPDFSHLSVLFINCTLKRSPRKSHTQNLIEVAKSIMQTEGVSIDEIRLIDPRSRPRCIPGYDRARLGTR